MTEELKPPPNTCPQIDKISVGLDAVSGDLEIFQSDYLEYRDHIEKDAVYEIVQQTIEGIQRLRNEFEQLRAANQALRDCGKYWYKKATNQITPPEHRAQPKPAPVEPKP